LKTKELPVGTLPAFVTGDIEGAMEKRVKEVLVATEQLDRFEMIEALKLEIDMIRGGRYAPPAGKGLIMPRLLRDSITCPNVCLPDNQRQVPCDECFLHAFMPARHSVDLACHDIPLNDHGDTIAKLQAEGDHQKTEQVVLGWLEKTVADLQKN
jgi:hypothetical protein